MSFAWNFDDGATATGAIVSHTFVQGGIYLVKLTARDNRGGEGVRYIMVTIDSDNPANTRPVASLFVSPRGKFAPVTMTADASASSDPNGDALTYEWLINDNQTGTGPVQTFTATQAGSYSFLVGVEDGKGGANSAGSGAVIVRGLTDPKCEMKLQDFGGFFFGEVFVSNLNTAPTNGWEVWWRFPAGVTNITLTNANLVGQNPYIASPMAFNSAIPAASWISFIIQGTKPSGLSLAGTEVMGALCDNNTLPPANNSPRAALAVSSVSSGNPAAVFLDAGGSGDADDDPLTYTWNFGDGTTSGPVPNFTAVHEYAVGGSAPTTRTVTVTVRDNRGGSGTATKVVTLVPQTAPLACNPLLVNNWANAFQLDTRIGNNGTAAISNPCVSLRFTEPTQITGSTGGTVTSISSTIKKVCLNGVLNAGQTSSVGIQATHDGSLGSWLCHISVVP